MPVTRSATRKKASATKGPGTEVVLFHRDIDAYIYRHLDDESRSNLRLVSLTCRDCVDQTIKKIVYDARSRKEVPDVDALLRANWNLESFEIRNTEGENCLRPEALIKLLLGMKKWTSLTALSLEFWLPENVKSQIFDILKSKGFVSGGSLTTLHMAVGHRNVNHFFVQTLVECPWMKNLEKLDLADTAIFGLSGQGLILFSKLEHLTALHIKGNYTSKDAKRATISGLAACTNLVHLGLEDTVISHKEQGFAELSRSLTNLTSLTINRLYWNGEYGESKDVQWPNVKKLQMRKNHITPSAASSLSSVFPSLTYLDIEGCLKTNESMLRFRKGRFPFLKELIIGGPKVHGGDWFDWAEFVAAGPRLCPNLTTLELAIDGFFDAALDAFRVTDWSLLEDLSMKCLGDPGYSITALFIRHAAEWNLKRMESLEMNAGETSNALIPLVCASLPALKKLYIGIIPYRNAPGRVWERSWVVRDGVLRPG